VDPKFGRDIQIKINPHTPYNYHDLAPIKNTMLTAEELAYPLLPLVIEPEPLNRAKQEWNKLRLLFVGELA
jgi:hypothetical protein